MNPTHATIVSRCIFGLVLALSFSHSLFAQAKRPNVILIMTDDQGLGDFGCMGNPLVKTPNVDRMYEQAIRFSRFYVCPVCSPTRASLMTGRYHYRTRVVDTFIGRSMMEPSEVTLAERFQRANYATGIFGKWHLGDCYPMRPHDRGFDTAVVHRGGGIGQSTDPIGKEGAYTDPVLQHNGESVQESGYCTDVYYDHALEFIEQQTKASKPFFVYLPDNCPHGPFNDVPKKWWDVYKDQDLSNEKFPQVPGGYPVRNRKKSDVTNRIFSMISNVDENIGRLQAKLSDLGIRDNTIVIFMTDNGPNGERYTCGLRGRKTSVYEGGIRTLFLLQWPAKIKTKSTRPEMAAHIDIAPTLIEACKLPKNDDDLELDGLSLMPLIRGETIDWSAQRPFLAIQTHRGNKPVKYHHFAAIGKRFKLVHHSGFGKESFAGPPKFELFDLQNDPYETKNVLEAHPRQFEALKLRYESWFLDVSNTRINNYDAPRIIIDPKQENPITLTRQDARRIAGSKRTQWAETDHWRMQSQTAHQAKLKFWFRKQVSGTVICQMGDKQVVVEIQNATSASCNSELPSGEFKITAFLQPKKEEPTNQDRARSTPVHQVEISFDD